MNPATIVHYLIGSSLASAGVGAIHGYVSAKPQERPWRIVEQSLTGLCVGPYVPVLLPYVIYTRREANILDCKFVNKMIPPKI